MAKWRYFTVKGGVISPAGWRKNTVHMVKLDRYMQPDIPENRLALLDEWMNTCYSGSSPDWMHITRKAMEAMQKFCAGSLSVEEVAGILVEEYAYVIEG